MVTQQLATVGIDGTRAYRGGRALHLATRPFDGSINDYVQGDVEINDRTTLLFDTTAVLRVFMYIAGPAIDGGYQLLSLGDVTVGMANGILALNNAAASTPFVTDRWTCIEVRSEPGDLGTIQTLWVDGQQVATDPTPAGVSVHDAGLKFIRTSTPSPAMNLWFDELVVDHSPVGC